MTYRIAKQKLNKEGSIIKNARRKICANFTNMDSIKALNDFKIFLDNSGDKNFRYELVEALRWRHMAFGQWNEESKIWKISMEEQNGENAAET